MDTVVFPPFPVIYSAYSLQSQRFQSQLQLHSNPILVTLGILFLSLSLMAAYPRQPRKSDGISNKSAAISGPASKAANPPSDTAQGTNALPNAAVTYSRRTLPYSRPQFNKAHTAQLAAQVRALQHTLRLNAFAAFRDRLLLSNRVWAQEREIAALRAAAQGSLSQPSAQASTPTPAPLSESAVPLSEPATASAPPAPTPSVDAQIRFLKAKLAAAERARLADAEARDEIDERREQLVAGLIREIAADLEESQRQVERLRAKLGLQDTQEVVLEEESGLEMSLKEGEGLDRTLCDELWARKSEVQALDSNTPADDGNVDDAPPYEDDDNYDSSSDTGSPTSTVAGDPEYDPDVLSYSPLLALKVRALEYAPKSPSLRSRSPSPSPSPSRAFLHGVHPQSPAALALGAAGAGSYTTSARLLARCARARSAIVSGRRALRFPAWGRQLPASEGESLSATRFPKRARVDSAPARS
jgi:hypothetical protein